MGVPPGGPEDKTAPIVVFSYPARDQINIPLNTVVVLEFSEMVHRTSVEASLYLSPEPGKRLRYRWSGRRLTLDYLDPLPDNRTIVVTVGAQARDLQGNSFEQSYTLAFSTGDRIDRGAVSGFVELPEESRSATVTAYLLHDSLPDPMTDAPDYRIQSDVFGAFDLSYLAEGRYRLFALDDRNTDGLWSPASEWIGTASEDVNVKEGDMPHVTFLPTLQDTTPLKLLRVKQEDRMSIGLRLNRDARPSRVLLADSLGILRTESLARDTSASGSWFAYVDRPLSGDSATLSADLDQETVASKFAISERPDSSRPYVIESYPVSRALISDLPSEALLIFSEPIKLLEQSDSLHIVLKEDTSEIGVRLDQTDPVSLTAYPNSPFLRGATYLLQIPGKLVEDRAGNFPEDSVLTLRWMTLPDDSLGNISGKILAAESGQWIVELYEAGQYFIVDSLITTNAFEFVGLPQADYLIRVVLDNNQNGVVDRGAVLPFSFSEPFVWHPETLSVRPRWTNETEISWTTSSHP